MTAIQASVWLPQHSLALRARAPNEGDTNAVILRAVEEYITASSKHRGRQRHLPGRRRGPRDPRPARRAGRGVPPGRDELSGNPPPSRVEGQPFVSGIRSPRISRRACWRLRSPASACRSASCRMVSVSSVALSVPSILKSDGVDRDASSHMGGLHATPCFLGPGVPLRTRHQPRSLVVAQPVAMISNAMPGSSRLPVSPPRRGTPTLNLPLRGVLASCAMAPPCQPPSLMDC